MFKAEGGNIWVVDEEKGMEGDGTPHAWSDAPSMLSGNQA